MRGALGAGAIPAARGWSRRPLHRANLRGAPGRKKRWDYWCVLSEDVVVAITYADVDYLGLASLWILEQATSRTSSAEIIVPLSRGIALPDEPCTGTMRARGRGLALEIRETPPVTRALWTSRIGAGGSTTAAIDEGTPGSHPSSETSVVLVVRCGMRSHPFGSAREPVSVIGQGTWNLERSPRRQAIDALRAGLDAGMGHVDTAEMYGSGEVERIVGEAIAGRREEVFLVTKVLPSNASRRGTVAACDRSLARLGTDRIDLYLLHWPGPHPLAETIAAFEELRQKGKIRSWGLSNFDVDGLEQALSIAGDRRIAADQVLYHLNERAVEHAVLPWCARHEIAIQAYSPFGSGDFPAKESAGGRVLASIARSHGATPHQVALAFLIRDQNVFAIPKTASAARAVENARAADLTLSEEEIAKIEQAFPRGKPPGRLPTI